MPAIDRNTAAIITSALRFAFILAILAVTAYYNYKPGLRGRVSDVLFALVHSLVFTISNELCVRVSFCLGDTNVYRAWGSVIWIHFVLGWYWYLRADARLFASLTEAANAAAKVRLEPSDEGGIRESE